MAKQSLPIYPTEVVSLPQPPLRKAEDYLNAYSGYTYGAVGAISQEVASIQLHLFKRKFVNGKPKVDEIFEHPALSVLAYANRLMTQYDLLEATQIYLDLVGESFWVLLRDGDEPAEIWPVRPDWMKVVPSKTNVVDSFIYSPGGTSVDIVKFDPKDVIHFKYFNPKNPYRGKGTVQAGAMAIDIHTFAQEYNRNFFFNSALPGLVFTTEQKLSQDAIKRFMEQWQSKFGGKGNSNKVGFIGGGMKVEKISQTARDMDFKELQSMMRDDILAVFKVPKTIIGLTDDVNRANAEATTRSFMERVVTPRMKKIVTHLNEFFLPNWQEDVFFDFDDPAPEDTELKLKIYESGLNLGWLTPNEVREQENLPPVEGGDKVYISFGKIPLGTETQKPDFAPGDKPNDNQDDGDKSFISRVFNRSKKESSQPTVIALPVKETKKKERKFMMPIPAPRLKELHDKKLKGEIKSDLIKLISNLMANGGTNKRRTKKQKSTWSEEKRENHWKEMVAKTDIQESKYKSALVPLFNDQEKQVINNINNSKNMVLERMKGKESSFLFSVREETSKWVSVLIPLTRDIVLEAGAENLDFLGQGGELDTTTEDFISFLREHGTELMQAINETTRDDLKKTLAEGLQKGEGIDKLKARVESVFTSARGPRAEMIARSETLRATNFATEEAYRQSGIVKAKEWLTAVDERVCPWCAEMDGKIIPVEGSYFKEGDELTVNGKTLKFDLLDVDYPPLHPSCRCTLIPVL